MNVLQIFLTRVKSADDDFLEKVARLSKIRNQAIRTAFENALAEIERQSKFAKGEHLIKNEPETDPLEA